MFWVHRLSKVNIINYNKNGCGTKEIILVLGKVVKKVVKVLF